LSDSQTPPARENPIDATIEGIIRRKARSLVGCAGLTRDDCPDVEQELRLRLLRPLWEEAPTGPGRAAFAQLLVERFAANILRDRQAAKRHGGTVVSLATPLTGEVPDLAAAVAADERGNARGTAPRDERELRELALDVAGALERLPDELRPLVAALLTESLTALARRLGVPRSTLRDRLRVVRERFARGNLDEY
jgi:DNA-directed RNA polymerase specialized sigma24 family protein